MLQAPSWFAFIADLTRDTLRGMAWDFQIVQITAAGTFGTVCVAFDWETRAFYALKVLKEHFQHNRSVVARTHDEATMLSHIRHENVLEVHALLNAARRTVVVMEWIQGCSLADLLEVTPKGLDGPVAAELIRQTARGLYAAYQAPEGPGGAPMRIIHRDLKPSNILLSLDGAVKVVDFGVAGGQFQGKSTETDSMVLGARPYMAPERLDGAEDAPDLDVYSLGVVLFELLDGEPLNLSLRPAVHPRQVQDGLARLQIRGFSPEGAAYLRHLLEKMLSYEPSYRPKAGEIDVLLRKLFEAQGITNPLGDLVERRVRPIFEANSLADPRVHDAYPGLAFLDHIGPTEPGGNPDIDRELTRFLNRQDWSHRVDELWRMLLLNPCWSARPFIVWLDGRAPRWRFWETTQATVSQRIALLRILGSRIDDEVRLRIKRFTNDGHPNVRKLARALLQVEDITSF